MKLKLPFILTIALLAASLRANDGGGTQVLSSVANNTSYSHYKITGTLNVGGTTGVTIDSCAIGGFNGNGIVCGGGATNLAITNCTFTNGGNSTGIYSNGPGTFVGCNFNGNTFTGVYEPIHLDFGLSGASQNIQVCQNVISGYSRIGIELQYVVNGIKVNNNYVANRINTGKDEGGLMALSLPLGGSNNNGNLVGSNIEVAYNTLIGPAWANAQTYTAIEIAGNGPNVHDNYEYQWGNAVMWMYLGNAQPANAPRLPWFFANNILVGCSSLGYNEGAKGVPFGISIAPTQTPANQTFTIGAANQPPIPTIAQTLAAGTGVTPPPVVTPPAQNPAQPTFQVTPQVDGIHLSLPGTSGTLTWTATGNTTTPLPNPKPSETHSTTIAAGTTSYVDGSVPNGWEVFYDFTGSPVGQLVTALPTQVIPPPAVTPPVVTPPPATQPAITIGHSLDGGKSWVVDATVQ